MRRIRQGRSVVVVPVSRSLFCASMSLFLVVVESIYLFKAEMGFLQEDRFTVRKECCNVQVQVGERDERKKTRLYVDSWLHVQQKWAAAEFILLSLSTLTPPCTYTFVIACWCTDNKGITWLERYIIVVIWWIYTLISCELLSPWQSREDARFMLHMISDLFEIPAL